MASPAANQIAAAQPLLPDEILEDIFLLLDSGADLARASATCRSFRRVATGHRFLRRFLPLHPPPIVGLVKYDILGIQAFRPVDPPHQSAAAARAVAQAGDFTFSFLPSDPNPSRSWIVQDVRNGRFLLARQGIADTTFLELVVCDPLYRRYVLVPPIPGDQVPRMPSEDEFKSEPFLAPASDEKETEEGQRFRVIYNFVSTYKIVSFVFSATTGKWRGVTSFSFLPARLIQSPKRLVRYYACCCFYWVHHLEEYMLVLDPREMKFSLVELLHYWSYRIHDRIRSVEWLAVMDAAEGRLGLLAVSDRRLDIYSRTCQHNGAGAEEWRHDKYLPVPEPDYFGSIIGAAEGHILLSGATPYKGLAVRKPQHYAVTLNLKTLFLERLCVLNDSIFLHAHPYSSFPPPLSLPSL